MATERIRRSMGLRVRVTAVAVLTVGLTLAVGGALLVGVLRDRLESAATTAATLRARDVAALAEAGSLPYELALPGEESAFVQVVDDQGAVIASTRNIQGEGPISDVRPLGTDPMAYTINSTPLNQASPMRVVAFRSSTPEGVVTVFAGESLASATDTTSAIVAVLGVGLSLLLATVGAVTWWAVGRTLRPVRRITHAMADISAHDLHRRVPVPPTRDEIGELAATVNETLGRLDTALERQRRFVADASHELRGPLAALRADLEISITHPDRTSWTSVARDTLGDVQRLQHLTDDLLMLARLDASQIPVRHSVDLAATVNEAIKAISRTDIELMVSGTDAPAIIEGDPDQLQRMMRNLIHNAEGHAAQRISISVNRLPSAVQLVVGDDGPGIPEDKRAAVFERFVRLDTARTRDNGGTGLGLAIVSDVVASHGGSISVTEQEPHGARFVIEIPLRRPL